MDALERDRLQNFVNFCDSYITGDEKGEAQVFLDHFFQAFGHEGAMQAGAVYEKRIEKGSKKGKTGFADLVWKPRVLVEMKRRGADLSKHYSQAFEYWQRAVPNRPRYVMLCNFDQFWIYDFDIQIDTPIDRVMLADLPNRAGVFGFMLPRERPSVFGNNQVEVTEKAARRLGEGLYPDLWRRLQREQRLSEGEAALMAQRFVLQCVLAMFAEDRGLLPDSLFIRCVQDCIGGKSSYNVISRGLFEEMNRPGVESMGRFKGVDYFNGGLFAKIDSLELTTQELRILEASGLEDWSKVRPAIFGSIFESAIDQGERHAHGIHYTSEGDIMKIIRPTISRYWEERIEGAGTLKELEDLRRELAGYRVLDPACGSGNFLYLAYRELKRLEQDLLEKIGERRRSGGDQVELGFVTPLQFFGLDSNGFAVELARVTLMIARKVAIDELGLTERALPLDTLDNNIVCADALFTEWPRADAIIGNPPFLGGNRMRQVLGDEYIERVFSKFPEVKSQVDFCCYWFRLAHENSPKDQRVGLVGTNTISQGNSRSASLEYVTQNGGFLHDVISTQEWSGDAKVHVSLVNWCYQETRNLYLDNISVNTINSSLNSQISVSKASSLRANKNFCFEGAKPNAKNFFISKEIVDEWLKINPKNQAVLKLFLDANDLTKELNGQPSRWIIDFENRTVEDASMFSHPFNYVREYVKPERDNCREKVLREKWWRFKRTHAAMRNAIAPLDVYFAVPAHSKWFIFLPSQPDWLPGNSTKVVASNDYYVLGILTSKTHRTWVKAQSSTLKGDTRYTHNTCFETFPFPQTPTPKIIEKIRQTTLALHQYRSQQMEQKQWGITKLYNAYFDEPASQLYKLHQQLDSLTLQAYGFTPQDDILEKLLTLNHQLAAQEQAGQPIIGPHAP